MTRKKTTYTADFKANAIEMTKEKPASQVALDLGISESNIRRWIRDHKSESKLYKDNSSTSPTEKDLIQRIKKLEKENLYLKKINDVLKKSTAIFSNDQISSLK